MTNKLNADQLEAADAFFEFLCNPEESCMVITGKPGTGKTFLVEHLLAHLPHYAQPFKLLWGDEPGWLRHVKATATTNQAAQVLADTLQQEEAKTIYSHLGLRIKENYKTGGLDIDTSHASIQQDQLLIVDEASYVTDQLLDNILRYTHNCKILFLGDKYQLTMPFSKSCPVFERGFRTAVLTISERTRAIGGNDSLIARMAEAYCAAIDGAPFPILETDGNTIIPVSGPEFKQLVDTEFSRPGRRDTDAKILAWSNKTVQAYNQYVRCDLLGYAEAPQVGETVISNSTLTEHAITADRRYQITQVNVSALQGFEGWQVTLDRRRTVFVPRDWAAVDRKLKQLFKEKNFHNYFGIRKAFADLRAPYAGTVHKAQGSTFHTVFLDLSDIGRCTIASDTARMLNTGISRAAQRVYLYGQLPARYLPSTAPSHGGTTVCQFLPNTSLILPR